MSLKQFWNKTDGETSPPPNSCEVPQGAWHEWAELVGQMLASVNNHVFAKPSFAQHRECIDAIGGRLAARPIADFGQEFDGVMQSARAATQKIDEERDEDIGNVLGILKQTVAIVGSCADRSTGRMKKLERSLALATNAKDIRVLKNSMSEMLNFVQQEIGREQEKTAEALASIHLGLRKATESVSRVRKTLGSRGQALLEIQEALQGGGTETDSALKWYGALFVAEGLDAIRTRYGNEVGEDLVCQLAKKQLGAVAPQGKAFAWTPDSVLLLMHDKADWNKIRDDIAASAAGTFDYQVHLGSRVATLSLKIRWMTMQLKGNVDEISQPADRFAAGGKESASNTRRSF